VSATAVILLIGVRHIREWHLRKVPSGD
jgi:hypothetical protein